MLNNKTKVKWLVSKGLTDYPQALLAMENMQAQLYRNHHNGEASFESVWLLEHAPTYTAGISANEHDLIGTPPFPVYKTKRGGQITYHGPGQRIVYVVMDLRRYGRDIRQFVHQLETWVIQTLAHFDVQAQRDPDNIGIWVGDKKIAALGLQIRHWISAHGMAINLNPNLEHFNHIIPCGIKDKGITSLAALGKNIELNVFDEALKSNFLEIFQIPSANLQSQHFALPYNESF